MKLTTYAYFYRFLRARALMAAPTAIAERTFQVMDCWKRNQHLAFAHCPRFLLALVLAGGGLLNASSLFAADDTQTGTNGASGVNGTDGDPGTAGTDGGQGSPEPVTATAGPNGDDTNTATATGGNGGQGGNGGNGTGANSSGGNGGNGGNGAAAEATVDSSAIGPIIQATANAYGGDGGLGGIGGTATGSGIAGLPGSFGNGGSAFSNTTATISASVNSGTTTAASNAYGGDGALVLVLGNIASGGRGGDAFATSETSAPTRSGTFSANSFAQGGNGGGLYFGGFTGNGGDGGNATADADVASNASIVDAQSLSARAFAYGGDGGAGHGTGFSGGNGGVGTINFTSALFPISGGTDYTAGHYASAQADQRGGDGGDGFYGADGGNGADSVISNRVYGYDGIDADFAHSVVLDQTAYGGNAGDSHGGTVGVAGNASSTLVLSESFYTGQMSGGTIAHGGHGGTGSAGAYGGDGGTATSLSDITNPSAEWVVSQANSFGGNGGGGDVGGRGGDATATAIGEGSLGLTSLYALAQGGNGTVDQPAGAAVARAVATGGIGDALALAESGGGGSIVAIIRANALAELPNFTVTEETGPRIKTTSVAESRGNFGGTYIGPTGALGMQAAAFATALPTSADVAAHVAGDPNVQTNFGFGDDTEVLGLVTLATAFAGDERDQYGTNVSSAYFYIDLTKLGELGEFRVGLLDPIGTIGEATTFSIFVGANAESLVTPIHSVTFNDTASALSYFDDQVIGLGSIAALDTESYLRVRFQLTSSADSPDTEFATNFLFANVVPIPEPSSGILLILSAVGLLVARRQGKRSRNTLPEVEI
jgi:hypothetical protein